jgi:hypothetical protein
LAPTARRRTVPGFAIVALTIAGSFVSLATALKQISAGTPNFEGGFHRRCGDGEIEEAGRRDVGFQLARHRSGVCSQVMKLPEGSYIDYGRYGPAKHGSANRYTGEDAKIIDLVLQHQGAARQSG